MKNQVAKSKTTIITGFFGTCNSKNQWYNKSVRGNPVDKNNLENATIIAIMIIAGIEQREISALFLLLVIKKYYNKFLEKVLTIQLD